MSKHIIYPEHIIDEQTGQEQAGHLQTGQSHEGDHRHTQTHRQRCREKQHQHRCVTEQYKHTFLNDFKNQSSDNKLYIYKRKKKTKFHPVAQHSVTSCPHRTTETTFRP